MAQDHWWHMQAGEQVPKQPQRLSLLPHFGPVRLNRFAWPVKWPARPEQVLTRWSNFGDAYGISTHCPEAGLGRMLIRLGIDYPITDPKHNQLPLN